MRALILFTAVFLMTLPASAQDRPLYNSKGASNGALYNKGTAGRPLSLKQITEGRSTTGYSYNRNNFQPYGAQETGGSGLYPTMAEIQSFRERRAAEAQAMEKQAMASLAQGHNSPMAPEAPAVPGGPMIPAAVPALPGQTAVPGQAPVKKIQRYKGRETGVTVPPKVFNSVR